MTRDEFEKAIDKISLDYPFRHIINYLKVHDAAQRLEIEHQAQQITTLREALQLLHDYQNGCPLPSYEEGWTRAMALTEEALKEVNP